MNESAVYFLRGIYESIAHLTSGRQQMMGIVGNWTPALVRLLTEAYEQGKTDGIKEAANAKDTAVKDDAGKKGKRRVKGTDAGKDSGEARGADSADQGDAGSDS